MELRCNALHARTDIVMQLYKVALELLVRDIADNVVSLWRFVHFPFQVLEGKVSDVL